MYEVQPTSCNFVGDAHVFASLQNNRNKRSVDVLVYAPKTERVSLMRVLSSFAKLKRVWRGNQRPTRPAVFVFAAIIN